MLFDNGNGGLPLSGSFVLGLVLYGAISVGVTGQVVADRTIKLGGYIGRCEAALRQHAVDNAPQPPQPMPKLNCEAILGPDFCRAYPMKLPFGNIIEAQQQALRQKRERWIARRVSGARRGCSCGAELVKEKHRLQWGLYAGSLRLSRPPSVTDNLGRELINASQSKLCS